MSFCGLKLGFERPKQDAAIPRPAAEMKEVNACARVRGQICAHHISTSAKWDCLWHPNGQNAFICEKNK